MCVEKSIRQIMEPAFKIENSEVQIGLVTFKSNLKLLNSTLGSDSFYPVYAQIHKKVFEKKSPF